MDENVPVLLLGSAVIVLVSVLTSYWMRNVVVLVAFVAVVVLSISVGAGIQDFVEGGFND